MFRKFTVSVSLCVALLTPVATFAEKHNEAPSFLVNPVIRGDVIAFAVKESPSKLRNVTVSITGPRNFQAKVMDKTRVPGIALSKYGKLFDGVYNYEITAVTDIEFEVNPGIDSNGRSRADRGARLMSASTSGTFTVREGKVVVFKNLKEEE